MGVGKQQKGKRMKMLVDDKAEGLVKLVGENVTLICARYIYSGRLVGVNDSCVKLQDAGIVYETGALDTKEWKDRQAFPRDWYIQLCAVESFGLLK